MNYLPPLYLFFSLVPQYLKLSKNAEGKNPRPRQIMIKTFFVKGSLSSVLFSRGAVNQSTNQHMRKHNSIEIILDPLHSLNQERRKNLLLDMPPYSTYKHMTTFTPSETERHLCRYLCKSGRSMRKKRFFIVPLPLPLP